MALGDELAKAADPHSWSRAAVVYLAGIGWSSPVQNVACPINVESEALISVDGSRALDRFEPCTDHMTVS